jgi:hypothetical protein
MPFGLQTKSLLVGAGLAIFVVPFIVAKINSRGK